MRNHFPATSGKFDSMTRVVAYEIKKKKKNERAFVDHSICANMLRVDTNPLDDTRIDPSLSLIEFRDVVIV